MKVIYPIIFRFGDIKRELLSELEKKTLHFLVIGIIKHDDIKWANNFNEKIDNLFYTTPIYKQNAQESPDYIAIKFLEWATDLSIVRNEKIINQDLIILIDLRGIDRDQQIYHISIVLNRLLKDEEEKEIKVILILEKFPLENDALFKHIFTLINCGKIGIIERALNTESLDDNSLLTEQAKNNIKGKLIKKIGHFNSQTNANTCKRYFYDGRYCDSEIRTLTLDYIQKQISDKKEFNYIFYISKESSWLKTSMSALSGTIEADLKNTYTNYIGAYNIEKITQNIVESYKQGHILLVADFINSTKTIKEAIITLKEKFPSLTNEKLHILSVLNNKKKDIEGSEDGFRSLTLNNEIFNVKYFVDVELEETSKIDCELCKRHINFTDIDEDNTLMFKSYNFWHLADLYGYEDEKVKPNLQERARIYVPIFTKWVKENAAYLSYKFDKFVELNKINTRLNFAIVYPDETRPTADPENIIPETASVFFAKKLREIFGATIIGIPRYIIDDITNKEMKLNKLDGIKDDWNNDIKGIPPRTDIIILDEFHKGGSTFESIKNILEYLNNPAKCYFSIVDFNPDKTKKHRIKDQNLEFYSLYEFNYH